MAALSAGRLREVLEPVVASAGYDLEDVSVTAAGRRSQVRVVVDRDEGVELDAVAALSRAVSVALDESPVVGDQPYVLEVSSRGVDRPLTAPRHWRRNVGRLVTTGDLTGRIVAATDEMVELDVDGDRRELRYDELAEGRVVVEFRR
jgi:ribosome maturation factor RimP